MRTLARLLLGALLLSSGALAAGVDPAAGQEGGDGDDAPAAGGTVDVIEVTGLIDPVVARFVTAALNTAEREGSVALVLQLDSPGSVLADDRFDELLERLSSSPVVVAAWVGPAGSQAGDEAAELVAAAELSGLAPESRLDTPSGRVSPSVALDRDLVDLADLEAATIGDFIVNIPGVESREIVDGDETRREPVTRTRFAQLPLAPQLLHTVASPPVAYLLFVLGMALILFELFTAGVGVAGVVGAGSLILGAYGLAVLPTSPVAVALLVVAMFGYGVDVQTGVPRAWTAIATVSFVVGSLLLFGDGVSLSWITLLIGVLGVGVAMLGGMPAMVRTRFSTPTIGREWMLGEEGEARGAVDPDGIVLVRDAPWRARTNRATPIPAGAPVRVAAIDGLVLEVEPLEGAAKDHRERPTVPGGDGGNPPGP